MVHLMMLLHSAISAGTYLAAKRGLAERIDGLIALQQQRGVQIRKIAGV